MTVAIERLKNIISCYFVFFCLLYSITTLVSYFLFGIILNFALQLAWNISLGLCVATILCIWFLHIEPVEYEALNKFRTSEIGKIVAHRGGAMEAPENTVAAIKQAAANGAVGVELDIHFTKDNVAVLIHDSDVSRTTDGIGDVAEMTFCQIKELNAAANHSPSSQFGYQQVPTLETAVKEAMNLGLLIYLDCKVDPQQAATEFASLFSRFPELYTQAAVCSFYPQIIYAVRRRDPKILTALTYRPYALSRYSVDGPSIYTGKIMNTIAIVADIILEWSHRSWLWYLCGNSMFLSHTDLVCRSMTKYWLELGIIVAAWTPNNQIDKDYFRSLNINIITDKVLND